LQSGIAVDIDDCTGAFRQKLGEQAKLLREIIFDARVIVQMIAREISEGASGKADAVDAALLKAMARCFHRQMRNSILGEPGEERV